MVCGVGSSIAFSRALADRGLSPFESRSASSSTMTCQRPSAGRSAARSTSWRMSSMRCTDLSVRITCTSECEPARTVRQVWHSPQPPRSHCRAAAKAIAALERPEPGWPGEEPGVGHAVARRPRAAAASIVWRWPTSEDQIGAGSVTALRLVEQRGQPAGGSGPRCRPAPRRRRPRGSARARRRRARGTAAGPSRGSSIPSASIRSRPSNRSSPSPGGRSSRTVR